MPSSDFRRANQLVRENRLEEAVAAYRSAIASNPNIYVYYQNLGEALEKLGYLEEATKAYRQVVSLHPQFPGGQEKIRNLLQRLEKTKESKQLVYQVSNKDNKTYSQSKEPTQPENNSSKHNNLPTDVNVNSKKVQNLEEPLEAYYKSLKTNPKSGYLYLQLAKALARRNKLAEAIVFYKIVLKIQPDSGNAADAYEEWKKCIFKLEKG
ncbi:tetratricopeptide repeat protein [Geitlerinema sp. PCC 9228]|uniref:tetratricopeptide repeat protein n=1 Tax=Geitlerinema sp. PCC 9228 TaxID=111611 RepID=UPI0008F995E6|nr:tetratricopeptide repeat protein [Geitlerinema sp. PCC 9228]